jgi:hypothetical protein
MEPALCSHCNGVMVPTAKIIDGELTHTGALWCEACDVRPYRISDEASRKQHPSNREPQ